MTKMTAKKTAQTTEKKKGSKKLRVIIFAAALLWFVNTFGGSLINGNFGEMVTEFAGDTAAKAHKTMNDAKLWFDDTVGEAETLEEKTQRILSDLGGRATTAVGDFMNWFSVSVQAKELESETSTTEDAVGSAGGFDNFAQFAVEAVSRVCEPVKTMFVNLYHLAKDMVYEALRANLDAAQ